MARAVKEWIGKSDDSQPPPRVLLRIFRRENGICHISGRPITPQDKWQGDHKIALINGGENRETNLYPALVDKHAEKTKRDLAEKAMIAAQAKKHLGITKPKGDIPPRGFTKSERSERRASQPSKLDSLPPRRALYR